jgi:hypothetical protein
VISGVPRPRASACQGTRSDCLVGLRVRVRLRLRLRLRVRVRVRVRVLGSGLGSGLGLGLGLDSTRLPRAPSAASTRREGW